MIILEIILTLSFYIAFLYSMQKWLRFSSRIFNYPLNGIECCYMLNYPEYGVRKRKRHNQLQGMCLSCKNKFDCRLYKEGKEIR